MSAMTKEQFYDSLAVINEHAGSDFMKVRKAHIRHLKGDGSAGIVLSFILNELNMRQRRAQDRRTLRKNQLWFRCPARLIQEDLGMTEDRQRRTLATLVEEGLVETCRRAGNTLWVRVIVENLAKIKLTKTRKPSSGENQELKNQFLEKPGTVPGKAGDSISTKNLTKNNTVGAARRRGDLPVATTSNRMTAALLEVEEQGPARNIAVKLFKACLKKGTLGINTPTKEKPAEKTTKAWAKEIDKLLRIVKPAEADAVVNWYVENMGKPYIPEVYCGRSFHKEFDKLRRAMARQQAEYVDGNGRTRRHEVDDNFVPEHLRW